MLIRIIAIFKNGLKEVLKWKILIIDKPLNNLIYITDKCYWEICIMEL